MTAAGHLGRGVPVAARSKREKEQQNDDGFPAHNVRPFTGRGRADDRLNHRKRAAAAVQCNGGLSGGRAIASDVREYVIHDRYPVFNAEVRVSNSDQLMVAGMMGLVES